VRRRFPGRFSPVILVDAERADAPEILKHWAEEGAEGVRLKVNTRSPGKDPLAIWKAAAELGLKVSCKGRKTEDFADDEFRKLIESLPSLTFIIEHLGKAKPDEAAPYPIYNKTLNLSKFPNVYIKVTGLGEICKRPYPFRDPFYIVEGVPPFVKMAYEAFGPSRMMWGATIHLAVRLRDIGTRSVTWASTSIPSAAKRIKNGFWARRLSRFSSSNKSGVDEGKRKRKDDTGSIRSTALPLTAINFPMLGV